MGTSCSSLKLWCGARRRKTSSTKTDDINKVKIRMGFDGKDTLMDPNNLNVKAMFGMFAVLLDYSTYEVVPLNGSGYVVEPLDTRRRYVVVVNTHGSSPQKWEDARENRSGKKHKHKKSKKSKRDKDKEKEREKEKGKEKDGAGGSELNVMANLSTKEIAVSSSQRLLNEKSAPNNGDEDL